LTGLAFRPLLNAVRSNAGALDPVSPESRRQHRADEVPERVLGITQGTHDVEFLYLTRGSRDIGFADLSAFQERSASQIKGRQSNAVDRSAFRQHRFQRGLRRRQLAHDAADAKVSAAVGVRHPRSRGLSFGSGCAHWAPLTASLLYRLYRAEPGVEKLRVDRWEDGLLRVAERRGSYRKAANANSCASRSTFRLIWVVTSNAPSIRPQLAIQSQAQRASSSGIGVGSLSWMRPRLKSSGLSACTSGSPAAQPSLKYDTDRRLSALMRRTAGMPPRRNAA